MIDDTRQLQHGGPGPTMPRTALRLSDHVEQILEHPIARLHASQWARSLRFLTFDDGEDVASVDDSRLVQVAGSGQDSPSPVPLRGQCQPCEKREPLPWGHMCAEHHCTQDAAKKREAELIKYSNPCVHVVEEDGTFRNVRAQNGTIDRVVAYARENGFRMIWIDQECIDQDNPKEKEIAIQSMDLVYLKARSSIGILHTRLQQKHLEYLSMVYESHIRPRCQLHRGKLAFTNCRKIDLDTMRETVSMVVNDKWNTRAWVLQEAFASSGNMVLLFPKADKVDARGWMMICNEASRSELAIRLDILQDCIAVCGQMIQPLLTQALHAHKTKSRRPGLPRRKAKGKENKEPGPEEIQATMQRTQFFHPSKPNSGGSFFMDGAKSRRTCSAAAAVTYLRLRDLERIADKVAIVANLCDYHLRLNTFELDKSQPSLSICILVLAIANGDFSLLIPQFYHLPQSRVLEFPLASGEQPEFSWAHSYTHCTQYVEAQNWNPYGPMSGLSVAAWVELTSSGLSFPGNLWKLNKFVDLTQIKSKYSASWLRIRQAEGPSRPSERTIQLATTHILFEISTHLRDQGEKQVANSILNSTSNWRWRNRDAFSTEVLESVDEFPSGLTLENRKGLFDLDRSPDGWFNQCWIIDRVMEKGGFWTGILEERNASPDADRVSDETGESEPIPEITELDLEPDISLEDEGAHKKRRGHAKHLFSATILSKAIGQVKERGLNQLEVPNGPLEDLKSVNMHIFTAPQALSTLALAFDMNRNGGHHRHRHERRAIFDVDGSTEKEVQVLTPFSPVLESIPRPSMRSMAVSWIVEDVGNSVGKDGMDPSFRVTGMVKGMWEFETLVTGRYNIT